MTAINWCQIETASETAAWYCLRCTAEEDARDGTPAYRHAMETGHMVSLATIKTVLLKPQVAEFGAVTPA